MEHRLFQRVKFTARGDLRYQGVCYQVRLENISLRGALVSSDECIMIPEGEECTLVLRCEAEDALLVITAEVRYSFFSMVGVRFVSFEKDAEQRLDELLQSCPGDPEGEGTDAPAVVQAGKARLQHLTKAFRALNQNDQSGDSEALMDCSNN